MVLFHSQEILLFKIYYQKKIILLNNFISTKTFFYLNYIKGTLIVLILYIYIFFSYITLIKSLTNFMSKFTHHHF